ncbi:MAG TPA: hypothetical protein VND02_06755 [Actinomycetota bacterium]|nr:hypothetical protein [Actinomycetota bacterium]
MATDRDEQQRQQQELEEIRRSFAEMGARMGSLFDPAEADEHQGGPSPPVLPPAPAVERRRPSWRLVAAAVVLLSVGTAFGWALAPDGSDSPAPVASPTTAVVPTTTAKPPPPQTVVSVPEQCVETAELADEVISRLNRNIRDERLFLALRDYTIASQACRREASP